MVCTFFGHRDCQDGIRDKLKAEIEKQIKDGVTDFTVGREGNFDALVLSCLKEEKRKYPDIRYFVVFAYFPTEKECLSDLPTALPDGIEKVPKRFAIDHRNRRMIEQCDRVIAFVTHPWGGAAKYVSLAQKRGKTVIFL